MPKPGFTDVTIVLDRSGSMESIRSDTIGGFNAFLKEQQSQPGECRLTLVQFDTNYEFVHEGVPVKDVPAMTIETFVPRGGTALLDAIGRAVNETGARLAAMPEHTRPEHVVFVILTDGMENSSREFNREKVMGMIKHQTDTYRWHFVFLGANQDAIQTGGAIGIVKTCTLTYSPNFGGVSAAWTGTSDNLSNLRSGASQCMDYTDDDRAKQQEALAEAARQATV